MGRKRATPEELFAQNERRNARRREKRQQAQAKRGRPVNQQERCNAILLSALPGLPIKIDGVRIENPTLKQIAVAMGIKPATLRQRVKRVTKCRDAQN